MLMRKLFRAVLLSCALVVPAHAELQTHEVDYEINGTSFTGYMAYDDSVSGKRPGVLVVHEWWGHNAFARGKAEKLAKAGYTAFALDMYGSGRLAQHPDDAKAFMQEATRKFSQIRTRFDKARQILADHETVDAERIAAQGYCFGGGVVLNMARVGADLDGVVSFHGSLGSSITAGPGDVSARIQVYTGGADGFVPPEQVAGFVEEMQNAGADLTLVSFPGVKHSFMNPGADEIAEEFGMPIAYDEAAAERSWEGTLAFYEEIFGE